MFLTRFVTFLQWYQCHHVFLLHFFNDVKTSFCYIFSMISKTARPSMAGPFQCPQLGWGHWVESRRGQDFKVNRRRLADWCSLPGSSSLLDWSSPIFTCCLSLNAGPLTRTHNTVFQFTIRADKLLGCISIVCLTFSIGKSGVFSDLLQERVRQMIYLRGIRMW